MIPNLAAAIAAVILPVAILAGPAFAQAPPGDVAAGRRLADQLCVRCHVTPPNQGAGWTDAPAFADIANRPGTTMRALEDVIDKPHEHMAGTGLDPARSADLAAYIMSMRHP